MTSAIKPAQTTRQDRINELHRCEPAHTALLVVDMQHAFLDKGASLEVPAGRQIIPNIRRLVDCCRVVGVPVVFTQFVYSPAVPCLRGDPFGVEHLPARSSGPTGFGHASNNCLIGLGAGTGVESADIIPELAPQADELVIPGHTYDKFYGTPLDLALHSRGITHLLVTGVTTDICVNCTVLSAANRNYYVTVVTDGVATIDDTLQESCMRIWERKFARLQTSAQLIAELNSASKDTAFDQ
jgi:ureidoacrylate peracid hydrolase